MRPCLFLLFFLSVITLAAQERKNTDLVSSHTLYSAILKEDRLFEIYTPSHMKLPPGRHYEVIYVLDGAAHFNTVVDILKQLAKETGDSTFTQKIVVGIGNIWERDRDYTPTHIVSSPFVDKMAAQVSGGGEKFISFLQKELIPYIDSIYPVASTRILIGHSLGGLLAIHTLLNHTGLFSKYAAIDPSMWWDDQQLLAQSKQVLAKKAFKENSLFLAIANTMNKDMNDAAQVKKDTSRKTALNRPSLVLADYINANKKNKLLFDWKYYKDFDHMSVFRSAAYDALKFLLRPL